MREFLLPQHKISGCFVQSILRLRLFTPQSPIIFCIYYLLTLDAMWLVTEKMHKKC